MTQVSSEGTRTTALGRDGGEEVVTKSTPGGRVQVASSSLEVDG